IGGRSDAARDLYAKALETITSADQQTPENLRLADIIRRKLASLDSEQRPAEALEQYRVLIASRQSLVDQDRKDPRTRMDLAVALLEAGEVQERLPGGRQGAMESYRRTLDVLRDADPNDVRMQGMAADGGLRLGRLLTETGQTSQAAGISSRALEI